jgi:hypothetical protein
MDLIQTLLGSLAGACVVDAHGVAVGGRGDCEVESGGLAGGVGGRVGAGDCEAAGVGDGGEDAVRLFSAIGGRWVAAAPGGVAFAAGAVQFS